MPEGRVTGGLTAFLTDAPINAGAAGGVGTDRRPELAWASGVSGTDC